MQLRLHTRTRLTGLLLAFLLLVSGAMGVSARQEASAVAQTTAAKALAIAQVAQATGLKGFEAPDVFLTVVASTLVVTLLCGVLFWVLGRFRLGNLVRYVPYPVVGGFLAGTGWLLLKGGLYVASGVEVHRRTVGLLISLPGTDACGHASLPREGSPEPGTGNTTPRRIARRWTGRFRERSFRG